MEQLKQIIEKDFPGIYSLTKGKKILIIKRKNYSEIFLVTKQIAKYFSKLKNKFNIICLGKFFGTISKKTFKPSFSTIAEYSKLNCSKKVIVNQKGEQTFLYGFNLEKKFIISFDNRLKINDYAIICNQFGEALGLGIVISDFKTSTNEQKVIKNVLDLGWYLRHKEGVE